MSLRSNALALRDEMVAELAATHDHFAYSQSLWAELLTPVGRRRGRPVTLTNRTTGTRISGTDIRTVVSAAAQRYLPSAAVGQLVSITEAFVADLIRLWVVAHPLHLRGPVDVQVIVAAADRAEILDALADQYVASLLYKSPRDWFRQLNAIVSLGAPSDVQVDSFAELKATRDVFVHNRGVANATYLRKAGTLARAVDGQPIDLPDAYVADSFRLCHALVTDVGTAAAARA